VRYDIYIYIYIYVIRRHRVNIIVPLSLGLAIGCFSSDSPTEILHVGLMSSKWV
jgi:hypothetical protein